MQTEFDFITNIEEALNFQDEINRNYKFNEEHAAAARADVKEMYDVRDMLTERMKNAASSEEKQNIEERISHCDYMIFELQRKNIAYMCAAADCKALLSRLHDYVDLNFNGETIQEVTV